MTTRHDHDHDDEFDRGLADDLPTFVSRRRMLSTAAAAGVGAVAVAVGARTAFAGGARIASSDTTTAADVCAVIPQETAGPYPGDGSNGPNVLTEADIVRSDIRSSIGSATGVADGVPLTIELTLTDTADDCGPLAGAAVYLWHCDREGRYSMYSEGAEDENYLRGVQESDADGKLTFLSIFPACYPGRWPHIHFEVYSSVADATGGGSPVATSQLAFPEDVCNEVYATAGYESSVQTLGQVSLESDMVFSDDRAAQQLATVTLAAEAAEASSTTLSGDAATGYVATLTVPV
jgi:protocatechuate 3,4-dioxygenase beta subunit